MDWSIQEIARRAGTTSRTLRHYGDLGLLPPSRIGRNGYRYYDENALVRLQRILLLRDLGLGLPAIGEVLARESAAVPALRSHLAWLHKEQERLAEQVRSVEKTLTDLEEGRQLMPENMFNGFDHTESKEEVEQRWGKDAYRSSSDWWTSMADAQKAAWKQRQKQLARDWQAAAESGLAADSAEAQALAQRHFDWLAGIPGTPRSATGGPAKEYVVGLGEMYVADERFAANYGGLTGAEFVRDALAVFAQRNL